MGTRLDLALRDAAEGTAPGVDADAVASRVPAEIREFLGAPTQTKVSGCPLAVQGR
jgi:hypothetical protein